MTNTDSPDNQANNQADYSQACTCLNYRIDGFGDASCPIHGKQLATTLTTGSLANAPLVESKLQGTIDSELDKFLQTLKVHNKDLGACFNDAMAAEYLKHLAAQEANKAVKAELAKAHRANNTREYDNETDEYIDSRLEELEATEVRNVSD